MAVNELPRTKGAAAPGQGTPLDWADDLRFDRSVHGRHLRQVRVARMFAEFVVVVVAHVAAVVRLAERAPALPVRELVVLLVVLVAVTAAGLHRRERSGPLPAMRAVVVQRVVQAVGATAVVWVGADPLLDFSIPRLLPVVDVLALTIGLWIVHNAFHVGTVAARRRGHLLHEVLLVGCGDEALTLERAAIDHPDVGLSLRGVLCSREGYGRSTIRAPWLGEVPDLPDIVRRTGADCVIVTPSGLGQHDVNEVVRNLLAQDVDVLVHNGLRSLSPARVRVHALGYEPVLAIGPPRRGRIPGLVKRLLDVVGALVVLVLTAPLLALCAFLVHREDGGPVLFRQVRIGQYGRPFVLLKLRTMHIDAEARLDELLTQNRREGPLFKLENDPRITRAGRILRATSIDELPQLLNVLRGEMSLVGPRPALPREMAEFDEELQARCRVTPGITGLWQVEARDSESFDAYRRLDLYYVENWSLSLDVSILATTVRAVGARAAGGVLGQAPVD